MTMRSSEQVGLTLREREAAEEKAMREYDLRTMPPERDATNTGQYHPESVWAEIMELRREGAGVVELLRGRPDLAKRIVESGPPRTEWAHDALQARVLLLAASNPATTWDDAVRATFAADPKLHDAYMAERRGNTRENRAWQLELAARDGRTKARALAEQAKFDREQVAHRELDSKVVELTRKDPTLTRGAAVSVAYREDPSLFQRVRDERDAAAKARRK